MHWSAYEVMAVVSGTLIVLLSLFSAPVLTRLTFIGIGGGLIAYGVYVATQTHGLFFFPVQLLVLPFVTAPILLWRAWQANQPGGSASGIADGGRSKWEAIAVKGAIRISGGIPGTRTCANDNCEQYGLPVLEHSCIACGRETALAEKRNAIPAHVIPPPVVTARSGEFMCPDPSCDEGGLRTTETACGVCGHATVVWT